MNFMRRKPLSLVLQEGEHHGLKKVLGALDLVMLGIGAIIGTGIFMLTGVAAANHAGPALVLSFVLSGLACGLAALAYAEFASSVPVAGSAYTYSYTSLGELQSAYSGLLQLLCHLCGKLPRRSYSQRGQNRRPRCDEVGHQRGRLYCPQVRQS